MAMSTTVLYLSMPVVTVSCSRMSGKLVVILLAGILATASGAAVVLSKDDFDTQVYNSGKHAFVKFYAPWCPPPILRPCMTTFVFNHMPSCSSFHTPHDALILTLVASASAICRASAAAQSTHS
jgi:hypothetical protein